VSGKPRISKPPPTFAGRHGFLDCDRLRAAERVKFLGISRALRDRVPQDQTLDRLCKVDRCLGGQRRAEAQADQGDARGAGEADQLFGSGEDVLLPGSKVAFRVVACGIAGRGVVETQSAIWRKVWKNSVRGGIRQPVSR
jgi:hypothetical protein